MSTKQLQRTAIATLLLGASSVALAEVGNFNNIGYGATRKQPEAKAKKYIEEACTSRNGKIVEGTFKVAFHKPLPTGQHSVDVNMRCDIP